MKFEVLPGLPAYGPPALPFSATGMGTHSEGYVVRFWPTSGAPWTGNFQPGGTSLYDVLMHPNGNWVVVVSGGGVYIVDPDTQQLADSLPGWYESMHVVEPLNSLLFSTLCDVSLLGQSGLTWRSRRLAWDGLRITAIDGATAHGSADHYDGSVHDFAINLTDGTASGGSYDWPEP